MRGKVICKIILLNAVLCIADVILFSKGFVGLSVHADNTFLQALSITLIVVSVVMFFYYNYVWINELIKGKNVYNVTDLDTVEEFIDAISGYEEKTVFREEIATVIEQIKRLERKRESLTTVLCQKFNDCGELGVLDVVTDVTNAMWSNIRRILNRLSIFDQEEYLRLQRANISREDEVLYEKWNLVQGHITYIKNLVRQNENVLLQFDKLITEVSKMGDDLNENDLQRIKDSVIAMEKMNQETEDEMDSLCRKYDEKGGIESNEQ